MSNVLTLSEIIRRGVAIEWPEGVALIRAVIDRLPTMLNQRNSVPELHHIELDSSGRVEVTGGQSADEPVRRMGQLLQAALGNSEPPVQLRLVISQATAPTPQFATIREFDEVLGYYERPNREGVLQAFYERAASAPPAPLALPGTAPTLDAIAPLPTRQSTKPRKPAMQPEEKRRLRRLGAVAVVLLTIIGAGVQYIRVTGSAERDAQLAQVAEKASSVVGDAVVSGLSAVTENVGLGRLVTEPSGAPAPAPIEFGPPAPAPATAPAPGKKGTTPVVIPELPRPMMVFDLGPQREPGSESAASPSGTTDGTSPPSSTTPTPSTASTSEPDMFTPEHHDVVPPVGIRPQLPRELPRNIKRDQLTRIDLVVAPDGTVETVKLVSSPRDVGDSMWLSAIKAWQFQPALKDGRAVRYLKTVWLAPR
jgi:hypothetical protein